MSTLLLPLLAALIAGAAIGLQSPLAAIMGQRVGLLQSAFIIHVGGAIVAGLLLPVLPGGRLAAWNTVPWYALWAGGLGVVLVAGISHAIPRMGVAASIGVLLITQLGIAALLDHHGWLGAAVRPFDAFRLLGLLLLVGGTWLILR